MHIKYIIAKEYSHITSIREMKQVVLKIWNDFGDNRWNSLIESILNRIRAVIVTRGGTTPF